MSDDLYVLANDLRALPAKAVRQVQPIFKKSALEIKRGMQANFNGSRHFKQVGPTVDYELTGGAGGMSAEVGPNASRGGAAALAGIAYFGGSNGGGGTVRDPMFHARDQGEKMVGFIGQAIEGLL